MLKCFVRPVILLAALAIVAGCRMDATIDAKGAGTMTLRYRLTSAAQLEPSKKRFQSATVKLVDAKIDPEKYATYELKFEDITKLSTAEFFHNAAFTLVDNGDGTKTLGVKFNNRNPSKMPDEMVTYFGKEVNLSVTLPGEVVKSNGTMTAGTKVTWTYPLNEFTTMKEIVLNATFKATGGKDGAAAGIPAAAAPAAAETGKTPAPKPAGN